MMTTLTHNEQSEDTAPIGSAAQFQTLSPIALRRYITELNRTQDELKERLRRQEQATRHAVGVGVLSVVLAAASIATTMCARGAELNANAGLARIANRPVPPVMVTMR